MIKTKRTVGKKNNNNKKNQTEGQLTRQAGN